MRDTAVIGLLDSLFVEQAEAIKLGLPDVENITSLDAEKLGLLDETKRNLRERFENVLTLFEENLHLLGVSTLVRAAHWDGNYDKAKNIIDKALKYTDANTNISSEERRVLVEKLSSLFEDLDDERKGN